MASELINVLIEIEKLVESFSSLDSYEALIKNIKTQIDRVAKNDTTGLYLFNKEENKLKLFYAKGFSEQEKKEAELTAMERHPGHVFTTGNILWVGDQDKEHNKYSIDSKKHSHTRSRMYVPVKLNNLIIGAFGIQSETPNAFTDTHLAVLKVFAALAGSAYNSIQNNLLIKNQNTENEKLSILAKSTTNNVIYTCKDGKITWVNTHFEESTGYFLDEIIGKTPGSFLTGKDTDPEKTHELRTAILNQKTCNTTILNYKKNGEAFIVAIQLNPVFNETGDLINFVAIQHDITEAQKQEDKIIHKNEQLKLREEQYNNIVNTTNDFIVTLDARGQIKFANNSWLKKMNYQLDEVIGTNIFSYIHPNSQEHYMLILNTINNAKIESLLVKYDLLNKNKVKIEIEGEVVVTYKDDGIYSINSYLKDVTEINKLRIEKENKIVELKESKERLENVLGSLSESVWGVSLPDYNLEYISESAVSIYGYPLKDWYDNINLWSDLIHPNDKEFVLKASEKLFDVGHFFSEYRIITADKKEKWIYSQTRLITNEKGIPILMTGITRDITENKIAEIKLDAKSVELKKSKEKLELVLNALNETTWGISLPSYKLEYISESAVALYGFPIKEWYVNVNLWVNIIHPEDKEFVLKENERLFSDGEISLEYRVITYDEKIKYIAANIKLVNNNEGIPVLLTGIAEDITEQKNIEFNLKKNISELKKTNAELDKFVYSTSHDLRAPLKSMMGLISITKESTDPGNNVLHERLEMLDKSVHKLDNFIEDILHYSRNSRMETERDEINCYEIILEIRNNLKFMEGTKGLKLQVEIHKGETFFSDKRRVSVILNNLISNAIKYSDDSKENMLVNIFVECSKENATITIEDNGIGIADKDKEKIFEMFYRATKLSTGSGLGMYIVKESLDKLGGTITLESELTKGTKFIVEIPNLLTSLK